MTTFDSNRSKLEQLSNFMQPALFLVAQVLVCIGFTFWLIVNLFNIDSLGLIAQTTFLISDICVIGASLMSMAAIVLHDRLIRNIAIALSTICILFYLGVLVYNNFINLRPFAERFIYFIFSVGVISNGVFCIRTLTKMRFDKG